MSFEGGILLSISLGLAVRIFCSDLESSQNQPLGRFWGDILTRGRFCGETWSRKKLFCGGMILWWGIRGIHPAQMNSMVPRTHMGKLLCPKTPLKIISRQIPQNPENWCRPLAYSPCGLPYFSLCPPLFPLGGLLTKPLAIMPSAIC